MPARRQNNAPPAAASTASSAQAVSETPAAATTAAAGSSSSINSCSAVTGRNATKEDVFDWQLLPSAQKSTATAAAKSVIDIGNANPRRLHVAGNLRGVVFDAQAERELAAKAARRLVGSEAVARAAAVSSEGGRGRGRGRGGIGSRGGRGGAPKRAREL